MRSRGLLGDLVLFVLWSVLRRTAGSAARALPSISDDIPFRLAWSGPEVILPTTGALYKEDNYVIMTTVDKEKYKCLLPLLPNENEEEEGDYKGPTPVELLEPLFKQSSCSYRIESYWTYEVCHGKYIRQYHEEKDMTQRINTQEYFLGNLLKKSPLREAGEQQEEKAKEESLKKVPAKNIDGQKTPYYPVEMGNGTPCSLKQNKPRMSTVMYICHPEARHEILSITEITTCEYEVMILTPLLCNHPQYRYRASPVNDIFCQSLPGSPLRPHSLDKFLEQQQELMKTSFTRAKEEETQASEEKFSSAHKPITIATQQSLTSGHISKLTDDQLIKEFLSGSYCFHGGVGWWKYEFCYGKYVHQYHEDKESGKTTTIVVGTWKKEEHIEWAKKKNVAVSHVPKADNTQSVKMVSHFYGNGDVCDLNEKPRQVIVKLKCKESESPHAVTLYMLEPHVCQYILGVESPVICKILDTADENGLLSVPD